MAVLLALFGPKRGVRLELEEALTVGRSSACGLQLLDEKVSREHCRFRVANGPVTVEDLGSQNGTFVNGERLSEARTLGPGDEIAVGDSLFVLDGEIDVAAARFGEATLVVAPSPAPSLASVDSAGAVPDGSVEAIRSLTESLAAAADLETAARAMLQAVDLALRPDRAFVLRWDAARRSATPLVGKSDGAAVSVSRTVLERAAAERRALAVEDAVEDRSLKEAKSVVRHKLRSVIVAPIVARGAKGSGDAVEGFLHADRQQPRYGAAEAALLGAFAAVAALRGLEPGEAGRGPARIRPAAGARPVGESAAMREILRAAAAAAAVPSTVLVTGESGTGKEEIARFVHESGARAGRPVVAVNCGALPESLAHSELFGHERGAFTGANGPREGLVEASDGGTLFLDEVGELSASAQVKLLRVLQERAFYRVGSAVPRRVDLRVIAATHRDLEKAIAGGTFREDLYYRINVLRLHLPPLRDRLEDLPVLARALLERICVTLGRREPGLSDGALSLLACQSWPGNARELSNVLERVMVHRAATDTSPVDEREVAAALSRGPTRPPVVPGSATRTETTALADKVSRLEKEEIVAALKRARGIKSRAAEALGISRPTLDKKIADFGIDLWREER